MTATSLNGTAPTTGLTPGNQDVDHVAGVLREHVLALFTLSHRAPSSVRVAARGVELEVSWATQTTTATPPPAFEQDAVPVGVALAPAAGETPPEVTVELCAHTVGVFYRAPEPGAPPFVTEGDTVKPGTQVAIIEAMKLMIPVEADRAGTVVEILVADGESVQHGQPLLRMEPVEPGSQR